MGGPTFAFKWRAPPDWLWRVLIFLLAVGLLVVITTRWNRWEGDADRQSTDDAYLQSEPDTDRRQGLRLRPGVPVQDFDHVRAGQLIVQIADDTTGRPSHRPRPRAAAAVRRSRR